MQEGGPTQGPRVGSCLTLRNELSKKTHTMTKQKILIGTGHLGGFPDGASSRERHGFNPWVRKVPWRRKWKHTPIFLPGESHQLAGSRP